MACTLAPDHALRAWCSVSLVHPEAIEVAFAPRDGSRPVRVHPSDVAAREHTVGLYLMAPETLYDWEVRPLGGGRPLGRGSLTTGTLPAGALLDVQTTGEASDPLLGFSSPCLTQALALITDADGTVLWYHDFAHADPGYVDGVQFTEDHTVLVVRNGGLVEVDLLGRTRLALGGEDLPSPLHHDPLRVGDATWVLYSEPLVRGDKTWQLDGFYVLDPAGRIVFDWYFGDHHEPVDEPSPGVPSDYSHANSLWVDAEGEVFVSLRNQSAVLRIHGPDHPSAGEIAWVMVGGPTDLYNDFVSRNRASGPLGFDLQHHVHQLPDGRWALFDNRRPSDPPSRLVVVDVDEDARVYTVEEAYDLDEHCRFQGGAYYTSTGNPLATCSPKRRAVEFDAGVFGPDRAPETPRWTFTAGCVGRGSRYVPRFQPLRGW